MARPKTASNILDARGAFKKNPGRKNHSEPTVEDEFPKKPPSFLTAKEKKTWKEIVNTAPGGVLTGADVFAVEIVARLLAEYREFKGRIDTARITRMTSEMAKLGLSPSARASLSVTKSKKNKYDD